MKSCTPLEKRTFVCDGEDYCDISAAQLCTCDNMKNLMQVFVATTTTPMHTTFVSQKVPHEAVQKPQVRHVMRL